MANIKGYKIRRSTQSVNIQILGFQKERTEKKDGSYNKMSWIFNPTLTNTIKCPAH